MIIQPHSFSPENPDSQSHADIIQFPDLLSASDVETIQPPELSYAEKITQNLSTFQENIRRKDHVQWPGKLRANGLDIVIDLQNREVDGYVMANVPSQRSSEELMSIGSVDGTAKDIIAISKSGDIYSKTYFLSSDTQRATDSLPWEQIKPGDIHEEYLPHIDKFLNTSIECGDWTVRTLKYHIDYITKPEDREFW